MAVRRISGGAISGYRATGSWTMVTRPMITMRIEMTMATMGRLMKNLAMRREPCPRYFFGMPLAAGAELWPVGGDARGATGVAPGIGLALAGSGSAGRGLIFSP